MWSYSGPARMHKTESHTCLIHACVALLLCKLEVDCPVPTHWGFIQYVCVGGQPEGKKGEEGREKKGVE